MKAQAARHGILVKGGNYLEGEGTLFTGMRREYPLFGADGTEQSNETTGFRVAIGALALLERARLQQRRRGAVHRLLHDRGQRLGRIPGPAPDVIA